VRPQLLIPAHGEALHLSEHANLARSCGVPKVLMCKNGDRVRIAPGDPTIVEQVPSGRLYKDGKILEDQNARAVVARRRLAFAGGAFVALALTEQGELADDPQVDLVGVPERNAVGELMDELIFDVAVSTFENLPRAKRRDSDAVGEAVRRAVRSAIAEHWGKKTVCVVHVLEV
jgi:ribonuclease J